MVIPTDQNIDKNIRNSKSSISYDKLPNYPYFQLSVTKSHSSGIWWSNRGVKMQDGCQYGWYNIVPSLVCLILTKHKISMFHLIIIIEFIGNNIMFNLHISWCLFFFLILWRFVKFKLTVKCRLSRFEQLVFIKMMNCTFL